MILSGGFLVASFTESYLVINSRDLQNTSGGKGLIPEMQTAAGKWHAHQNGCLEERTSQHPAPSRDRSLQFDTGHD